MTSFHSIFSSVTRCRSFEPLLQKYVRRHALSGAKSFQYWIVLVTTKHVVPFCSKKKRCRVCMFSRWFSDITLGLSTQTSDVCFLKTAALQKNYVSVKVGIGKYRLRRLRCWSSKSDSIPLDEINKSWLTICRFQKLGIKRSTTEINPSPSPMHLKSKCEVCICKTQDTLLCLASSFSNVICRSSGFFIQIESTQNERSHPTHHHWSQVNFQHQRMRLSLPSSQIFQL